MLPERFFKPCQRMGEVVVTGSESMIVHHWFHIPLDVL